MQYIAPKHFKDPKLQQPNPYRLEDSSANDKEISVPKLNHNGDGSSKYSDSTET